MVLSDNKRDTYAVCEILKSKKGDISLEYKHESGLTATFDFDTVKEAVLRDGEPIYIYKDIQMDENNITMTIDEAKWLVLKLKNLIKAFENELDK